MPISAATFTTPPTFASTALTDSLMNNLIGVGSGSGGDLNWLADNVNHLLNARPRVFTGGYTGAADYTITGTAFTAVDTTNLRVSITTQNASSRVLLFFFGILQKATIGGAQLDFFVDGAVTRLGGTNGLCGIRETTGGGYPITMFGSASGLTAAAHTFDVCWRSTDVNTATLYRNINALSFFGLEI